MNNATQQMKQMQDMMKNMPADMREMIKKQMQQYQH